MGSSNNIGRLAAGVITALAVAGLALFAYLDTTALADAGDCEAAHGNRSEVYGRESTPPEALDVPGIDGIAPFIVDQSRELLGSKKRWLARCQAVVTRSEARCMIAARTRREFDACEH